MLELNAKVNTDYTVISCWRLTCYLFLEKMLTVVLISFLLNMNSTNVLSETVANGIHTDFLQWKYFLVKILVAMCVRWYMD